MVSRRLRPILLLACCVGALELMPVGSSTALAADPVFGGTLTTSATINFGRVPCDNATYGDCTNGSVSGTVSGTLSGVDAGGTPWKITFVNAPYTGGITYNIQNFGCPFFVHTRIAGVVNGVGGVAGATVTGTHGTDQITSVVIDFNQTFNDPVNSVLGTKSAFLTSRIVLGPKNVNVGPGNYSWPHDTWRGTGFYTLAVDLNACSGGAGTADLLSEYAFHLAHHLMPSL